MTLETLIAEAASSGRFNLTVFQTADGFQASFGRDISTWRVERAATPADAIRKALADFAAPAVAIPAANTDIFS